MCVVAEGKDSTVGLPLKRSVGTKRLQAWPLHRIGFATNQFPVGLASPGDSGMGASIEDDDRSDGSYDSDFTGSSGSDSESDTFSPQQAAQVRTPIWAWAINSQPGVSL